MLSASTWLNELLAEPLLLPAPELLLGLLDDPPDMPLLPLELGEDEEPEDEDDPPAP